MLEHGKGGFRLGVVHDPYFIAELAETASPRPQTEHRHS